MSNQKMIKKISEDVRIYHDTEWEEYIVKIKGYPKANYHTDDLEDAKGTAKLMQREVENNKTAIHKDFLKLNVGASK